MSIAGITYVLTRNNGYGMVSSFDEQTVEVWNGVEWVKTEFIRKDGLGRTVDLTLSGNRKLYLSEDQQIQPYEGGSLKASEILPGDRVRAKFPNNNRVRVDQDFHNGFVLGYLCHTTKYPSKERDIVKSFSRDREMKYLNMLLGNLYSKGKCAVIGEEMTTMYSLPYPAQHLNNAQYVEYVSCFYAVESFLAGIFLNSKIYKDFKSMYIEAISRDYVYGVRRLLESVGILSHVSKYNAKHNRYYLYIHRDFFDIALDKLRVHNRYDNEIVEPNMMVTEKHQGPLCPVYDSTADTCFMAEGILLGEYK